MTGVGDRYIRAHSPIVDGREQNWMPVDVENNASQETPGFQTHASFPPPNG